MKKRKIKKIILAKQDKVKMLETYIKKILTVLGYEEALVTDESLIYDFFDVFWNKKERQKKLKTVSKKLGIDIGENELIIDVAKRLKDA